MTSESEKIEDNKSLNPRIKIAPGLELSPEQITELNKIFISVSTNDPEFNNDDKYFLSVSDTLPLITSFVIGQKNDSLRVLLTNPGGRDFAMEVFAEGKEN